MSTDAAPYRWTKELTRYHWFVLGVAALGWMFDCLDQQLFTLARTPAMKDLLKGASGELSMADVNAFGGYATAIFLMGWATGGLAFGVLGDRIGRAKTMMITILLYSLFTGLSAFSVSFWDFAFYRFLTGLGVGGEFAVGVALVAEVMPDRARPFALGLLQALSAFGNIGAAFINIWFGHLEQSGIIGEMEFFGIRMTAWRLMFVVGMLPALLAVVIRLGLKEPERWQQAVKERKEKKSVGSYAELFGNPLYRKRAIVGTTLAASGVIGLWGIGFFSIDLNRSVFGSYYEAQAREAGAATSDRDFVLAALANPAEAAEVAKNILPSNLISPDGSDTATRADASVIYQSLLALHKENKSVTPEAIMQRLDEGNPATGLRPQSSEDRQRRLAYLGATPSSTETLTDHVKKIDARSKDIEGSLSRWAGITSLLFNIGAFLGIYTFSRVTHLLGRKPTFALAFIAAFLSTAMVFGFISARTITIGSTTLFVDVLWMIPIMGFCQLSIFGGYAIYFPELFPTRLRSTGTSFCYNVGRFVAAAGPFTLGALAAGAFRDTDEPLRWAGLSMCSIFLFGLLVLPFAPETRGQPLPD